MAVSKTEDVIAEIRAEMARQQVTQVELAPRTRLSLAALRRRLAGESPLLVSELFDIAKALRVPVSRLVDCPDVKTGPSRIGGQGPQTEPLLSKGAGQ
jgi:hypothetical protein